MVSFFEIVFTTVFLIWAGRLVFRQGWPIGYKVAAYFFGAFFMFALWNRPLGGQWGLPNFNPLIIAFSVFGVVIAANWAYRRWGADNRVAIAIVAACGLLILLFCWPIFVAGPSSITPSIPTAPSPVASAPTTPASAPAAPAPGRSRHVPQVFDIADCPNVSYEWQKDMGCPGVQ
jgi:hypothetical protein